MSDFMYGLRVPKDRLPVLIGTGGETKEHLEEALNIRLSIDSEEGDVHIHGSDALGLYAAREVITAIARGFNPEIALELKKGDYTLEIIDLKDFCKTKKQLVRKRGRVIGEKGKSRTTIENLTDTNISVYGKTVAIIGRVEDAVAARRAVESLLGEAPHAAIYKQLERRRADLRRQDALWQREEINPDELPE